MTSRTSRFLAAAWFLVCSAITAPSWACGGGVEPPSPTPLAIDAQRAFISVRAQGSTDVVVQLDVSAHGDYGVLLPVPGEPWIDPEPIDVAELDALDQATRVQLAQQGSDYNGGGCGCGSLGADDGGGEGSNVSASAFVDVGPVTAVVLSSTDAMALSQWLDDYGFQIPVEHQSVVQQYLDAGSNFLAFKRGEVQTGESSVGVHFVLEGARLGYPLTISRLGAAPEVGITVFAFADRGVAPAEPFAALTLDDLGPLDGSFGGYRDAVAAAVASRDGRAFVLEGVYPLANHPDLLEAPRLRALIDPNATLTRMSTVVRAEHLQMDADLSADAPADVPTTQHFGAVLLPAPGRSLPPGARRHALGVALLLLPLLLAVARRRRWRLPPLSWPWRGAPRPSWIARAVLAASSMLVAMSGCFLSGEPLPDPYECKTITCPEVVNGQVGCHELDDDGEECFFRGCDDGYGNADDDITRTNLQDGTNNGCECVMTNDGVEIADGIDNDCDGWVDNCSPGSYEIPGDGIDNDCDGRVDESCGAGAVEVCDYQDNDCDNEIDETFDLDSDPNNCGGCGYDCAAQMAHAITECVSASCVLVFCQSGYQDADGNPDNGCEASN